jgi:hypothetical protein
MLDIGVVKVRVETGQGGSVERTAGISTARMMEWERIRHWYIDE